VAIEEAIKKKSKVEDLQDMVIRLEQENERLRIDNERLRLQMGHSLIKIELG
jgi:regulator of replication initiation timing